MSIHFAIEIIVFTAQDSNMKSLKSTLHKLKVLSTFVFHGLNSFTQNMDC